MIGFDSTTLCRYGGDSGRPRPGRAVCRPDRGIRRNRTGNRQALSCAGVEVVIASRQGPKLEAAVEAVRIEARAPLNGLALELSDIDNIDRFADAALALGKRIDMVIANAGVIGPFALSGAGACLEDCHVADVRDEPDCRSGVMRYTIDPVAADRMWGLVENLIGRDLPL